MDEPVALQGAEGLSEHLLADPVHVRTQLREALGAGGQCIQDEQRPDETVVAVRAFSPYRGETFVIEQAEPGFRPGKDIAGVIAPEVGLAPGWQDMPQTIEAMLTPESPRQCRPDHSLIPDHRHRQPAWTAVREERS